MLFFSIKIMVISALVIFIIHQFVEYFRTQVLFTGDEQVNFLDEKKQMYEDMARILKSSPPIEDPRNVPVAPDSALSSSSLSPPSSSKQTQEENMKHTLLQHLRSLDNN